MRRLAAIFVLLFGLAAAPAGATSTVVQDGTALVLSGTDTVDAVTLATAPAGQIVLSDPGGITAGGPCVAGDPGSVVCDIAGIDWLRAELLDGDDTFATDPAITLGIELDGGAGRDVLEGGAAADILWGWAGEDVLLGRDGADELYGGAGDNRLEGGAGNDVLDTAGGAGADRLTGGPGDDLLSAGEGDDELAGDEGDDYLHPSWGADVIDGGAGIDWVGYGARPAPVSVTLGNGLADDGEAGEGDLVEATVENAVGGDAADRLVGDAGPNELNGGPGDDELIGGGGPDALVGWVGDDRLDLQDDAPDRASCGEGADSVGVDAADTVDPDCESVSSAPFGGDPLEPPALPGPEAPVAELEPVPAPGVRATPRVRLAITAPRRTRRVTLRGRLQLPRGVDRRVACAGRPRVTIALKQGTRTLRTTRARLSSDCRFVARVTLPASVAVRRARLRFTARFAGNAHLVPRAASAVLRGRPRS